MSTFKGAQLRHTAMPFGGVGAGNIALCGNGSLGQVQVFNTPQMDHNPIILGSVYLTGHGAKLLEGPINPQLIYGANLRGDSGNAWPNTTYGLPRFEDATFAADFPFAHVDLADPDYPLTARITGFSAFVPGDAEASSLPAMSVTYTLTNPSSSPLEGVFTYAAMNFMAPDAKQRYVTAEKDGFCLRTRDIPERADRGFFVQADRASTVQGTLFRGGWFDPLTMLWNQISSGQFAASGAAEGQPSPGGALSIPFALPPGAATTITIRLCWYVPDSILRHGLDDACLEECKERKWCGTSFGPNSYCPKVHPRTYVPWYATRFANVDAVAAHFAAKYDELWAAGCTLRDLFKSSTLPETLMEAALANLSILRSPTCLIQHDGRFWGWEGCHDQRGCCAGSCTHVWNYQQALCHLFPTLERSMRDTELWDMMDDRGHVNFRAGLPIRPVDHNYHAAADGQLGGIMKCHRDWKISGDTQWLKEHIDGLRRNIEYCINLWDPERKGILAKPHHNTYDIEFWGPDALCQSFYIGALKAMALMCQAAGAPGGDYDVLYQKARAYMEDELFNGEYFYQRTQWEGLGETFDTQPELPEAHELLVREGPKYQYGTGCLSDGVLGDWMARMCGVGPVLDEDKVRSHLLAIFRHNFKADLFNHANPQRPGYALGHEGGLLACSWPNGDKPSIPFPYSDEVWTGIEYQVAGHLLCLGCADESLTIVKTLRARYDGTMRNPFNEYECGHYYARAMASYGLLPSASGAAYDAVTDTLTLAPPTPGDFMAPLFTRDAWALVGLQGGKPVIKPMRGQFAPKNIKLEK